MKKVLARKRFRCIHVCVNLRGGRSSGKGRWFGSSTGAEPAGCFVVAIVAVAVDRLSGNESPISSRWVQDAASRCAEQVKPLLLSVYRDVGQT